MYENAPPDFSLILRLTMNEPFCAPLSLMQAVWKLLIAVTSFVVMMYVWSLGSM